MTIPLFVRKLLAFFALLFQLSEVQAQVSSGSCEEMAEVAVLPSPMAVPTVNQIRAYRWCGPPRIGVGRLRLMG